MRAAASRANSATPSDSPRAPGSIPAARSSRSASGADPAQPASAARRVLRRCANAASTSANTSSRDAVVAVEIDRVLAGELPRTLAERAPALAGRVTVINADALRTGQDDLPAAPSMLVANLPYNVAVPVVLHLLAVVPAVARGLVMVQAEVADRMCAPPGSRVYGGPSVKLAWYATARPAGESPR